MENNQVDIQLLKCYLQGNTTLQQTQFIEERLANSEDWRIIYEGLLFASDNNIDTAKNVETLAQQIHKTQNKQPAKVVRLQQWKRWSSIAAAVIGIIVISYATVYFISPDIQQQKTANDGTAPILQDGDELLEIVESEPMAKTTVTLSKKMHQEAIAEETVDATIVNRPLIVAEDIIVQDFIEPQKQNSYLEHYGYYSLAYQLNDKKSPLTKIDANAYPAQGLNEFIAENKVNYIARFPFNAKVKVNFTVDTNGKVTAIKVMKSSQPEAATALVDLIQHKTEWKPALNKGKAVQQRLSISAQFGNSIALTLMPIQ